MVLHKFGDRLYNGLVETITKHLKHVARCIEETQGNLFLQELNKRWTNHNKSMQMIRGMRACVALKVVRANSIQNGRGGSFVHVH